MKVRLYFDHLKCPGCGQPMQQIHVGGEKSRCLTPDCKHYGVLYKTPFQMVKLERAK